MSKEIKVLYMDESFIAVSKPGGLIVHKTKESQDRVFLLQTLAQQVGKYLYPVHRLDRAASGVIIFAFSSEYAKILQENMRKVETKKEYITLVRGSTPQNWESKRPLSNDKKVKQEAHTTFEKICEFFRLSLIRARIYTGRRHQIRRHLAHEAHQIIGDTTHGKGRINNFFRENYGLPRLFLHARKLEIPHPVTNKVLCIEDKLPEDLQTFLLNVPEFPSEIVSSL